MAEAVPGPEDSVLATRAAYDALAPGFLEWWDEPRPDLDADLAAFVAAVRGRGPVADVGCGLGRDCLALRAQGVPVVGVDLSIAMLRAAGVAGLVQGDMRRLPLPAGVLGGIWCQAALQHVPRAQVPRVLSEFARVLGPGGSMHLVVSEGDGEGWEAGHYGSARARWFVHHRRADLGEMVTRAGFQDVEIEERVLGRTWLRLRARLPTGIGSPARQR